MRHTLTFRCPQCQRSSTARTHWQNADLLLGCRHCQTQYRLDQDRSRPISDEAYRDRAQAFADVKGLDLATAWSLLEGIVTSEQATALAKAVRAREVKARSARPSAAGHWPKMFLVALGLSLVAASVYGWNVWSRSNPGGDSSSTEARVPTPAAAEPAPPPRSDAFGKPTARPVPVKVWTDTSGRAVRLEGPDPGSVLRALCSGVVDDQQCEPLGLARAHPPDPGTQLGLFRVGSHRARAFPIRRDAWNGKWAAGDGVEPIAGSELAAPPGEVELAPVPSRPVVLLHQPQPSAAGS